MKKKGVSTLLVPNGITRVDGIIISIIIKSRMISIIEYHYKVKKLVYLRCEPGNLEALALLSYQLTYHRNQIAYLPLGKCYFSDTVSIGSKETFTRVETVVE